MLRNRIISCSISLLCALLFLSVVLFPAFAAVSGTLTDTNIGISSVDTAGEKVKTTWVSDLIASWTADGTSISGTITPGSTSAREGFIIKNTVYYPDKSAKTELKLSNTLKEKAVLSFAYTQPESGDIDFSENAEINGNLVSAELEEGQSVTVILTTHSSPSKNKDSDNRANYTATTELTNITLTPLTADITVTLQSVNGGNFTGSDGTDTKGEGETFSNPMTAVYSFTAGAPGANYLFDGWYFNGTKYADTSLTISDINFKADTTVEARYIVDPLYSIATASGEYGKEDLIIVNSRYYHDPENSIAAKGSPAYRCHYTIAATTTTKDDYRIQYVPSLQWAESGTKITVGLSGKAQGEYCPYVSNSWYHVNSVSDVIRIYAKENCKISFNYTNTISIGGEDSNEPCLRLYESASASETIGTVYSKGTKYTDVNTTTAVEYTLAKGKYLYIYANGYSDGMEQIYTSGYASASFSYTATISDVVVSYNEQQYTQSTTFQDNTGAALTGGKLTVSGTTYTAAADGTVTIPSAPSGQSMAVSVATAPKNYKLLGWMVDGTLVQTPTYSYTLTADTTINPIFVPNAVTFDTAAGTYKYLNASGQSVDINGHYVARNVDATAFYSSIQAGFDATDEVVLLGSVTINGDFQIPAGKTLIVPSAMVTTTAKDGTQHIPMQHVSGSTASYATLTLNGSVTVNGTLVVSSHQNTATGGPAGPYATMTVNSSVTVNSGAYLYGYGLTNGSGTIYAKSGSQIHEMCEIVGVPHPVTLNNLVNSRKTYEIMPINTFFVNTIEARTVYESGAALDGHFSLKYDNVVQDTVSIINTKGSLFLLTQGTATKYYSNGRTVIRLNEDGVANLGAFSIYVNATLFGIDYPATINTGDYILPLCSGYEFHVAGSLTIDYAYKMLPGSILDVESSGTLTIGSNGSLVFYRLNDYDYRNNSSTDTVSRGFTVNGYPINMSRHAVFNKSNVGSAVLNVDGRLVATGGLYVSNQLIDEFTAESTAEAYKNFVHYDNGYNYLTGSGEIVMGSFADSYIYENLKNSQDNSIQDTKVAITAIKGLPVTAAEDLPENYVSLKGDTFYGDGTKWYTDTLTLMDGEETLYKLQFFGGDMLVSDAAKLDGEGNAVTELTDPEAAACRTFKGWYVEGDTENIITTEDLLTKTAADYPDGVLYALFEESHTYGEPVAVWDTTVDPVTCTVSFTCTVEGCGHEETVTEIVITETEGGTAPSCADPGQKSFTASFTFGDTPYELVSETLVTPALGHTMDQAVPEKAPTCVEEGNSAYWHCQTCGKYFSTESGWSADEVPVSTEIEENSWILPNSDHTYGEISYTWNDDHSVCTALRACTVEGCEHSESAVSTEVKPETADAKCNATGLTTYTVTFAETWAGENGVYTEEVEIPKDPEAHAWDNACDTDCNNGCGMTREVEHSYTVTDSKETTCTETGYTTYTCSACGDSYTENADAAMGHIPGAAVEENRVEATCGEDGSYESVVYCSVCNAEISRETVTVDATGSHSYASKVTNPTCTAKGYTTYTCSACGDSYVADETEMIAHTPAAAVVENTVESTCTAAGSYDEVVYCSVCNTELSRETKALELAAHTQGAVVVENEKAATCTAEGSYDNVVYCSVCNAELSRDTVTVEATGHTYGEPTWAWTGSDDAGYTAADAVFKCACGDEQTVTDSDIRVDITAATYEAAGSKVYTAEVTFKDKVYTNTKTVTIPKLEVTGTKVNFVNYTATGENLATVTIDGETVDYAKKTAVEATLGADGKFTVTCARACVVAYTTDTAAAYSTDSTFVEALATANADGSYSFTIENPVEGMTIAVLHRGDVDLNGSVNVNDAARVQRNVALMTSSNAKITNLGIIAADVDGRNGINVNDAARIQRNAALMTTNNAKISWHTA